jgi:hypothetical protein
MVTVKDHENNIPWIVKQMKQLDGTEVSAGVHGTAGSKQVDKAMKHEFGLGNVPKRPFVRPAWSVLRNTLPKDVDASLQDIVENGQDALGAATKVGLVMYDQIRREFGEHGPPLSPITIAKKGSSAKLVDTGRLKQSLAAKVDGSVIPQTED